MFDASVGLHFVLATSLRVALFLVAKGTAVTIVEVCLELPYVHIFMKPLLQEVNPM
jgi:hypothetical protein